MKIKLFAILICVIVISSCRKDDDIISSTSTQVGGEENGTIKGFFLLNEGNMGSNKATLDYYDYETGVYTKNIYAERNPGVVKELGDVGNDLQIYGDKLYAVINCSHFVEVMDVNTAKHITQVSVPNCRYVVFKDQYAYVSSYAGPVLVDPNARLGYVAKIDTATLVVKDTCVVGYQPEQMVVVGNKLYVANSGGYRVPNYDNTVSVIDLVSFKEIKKIPVAINLHRLKLDKYGKIWVSSRGDYYTVPSMTFVIDPALDVVTDTLPLVPNTNMTISGDSMYVFSTEWSYITNKNILSYSIVDVRTHRVLTRNFITDGTEENIQIPYGLAVNPDNGDVLLTDAKDYVTPGTLYCFSNNNDSGKAGVKKWSVTTGDIPAHFAFTYKKLKPLK